MIGIGYILFAFYILTLSFITVFCLMQFHLLYHYKKGRNSRSELKDIPLDSSGHLPFVTIQLPIFNEMYVVERLIDNIIKFDYPKDRYEIHILDDSTDETLEISRKRAAYYQEKGYNIEVITRSDRSGFKAGALKYGMQFAKGDYIAIFDADFLPHADFLRQTMPYFKEEKVGVVQTRWEHINQGYSLITELQAFQLNVHFTIEQRGRDKGNYLLQFNGTAGVWRKETIYDAGGWEADTLTEDLDLSYRAQMKGWKIEFLENIVAPAELPAEMNGLKSQQFRWMKGGAETAKKMLPMVWKSNLSLPRKIHASVHLLSSSIFLLVFLVGVFSVPILFYLNPIGVNKDYLTIFMISLLSIIMVYYVANVQVAWKRENYLKMIAKFVLLFPIFLSLSMGLSLHNSVAVLQGYLGKKTPFVRTPKFGIKELADSFNKQHYLMRNISKITIAEGFMAFYFLGGIIGAYYTGELSFILFHILLLLGYGTTFFYSIKHAKV
jgi:cellulose synthase/poly-beta-1,6-N-acetylglucosamine synthase-like glycosyltransferase